MDEQEMDVIERPEMIDLDGPEADPRRGQMPRVRVDEVWERTEAMRMRAAAQAEVSARRVTQLPMQLLNGAVGALPVQTREHLRQSARESVLAVSSLVEAVSSAALIAVDRIYADPRTPRETAQSRRIVIEHDEPGDEPGSPS